ncbi:MAG: glycosyltransferase family 4 protein [Leucobacter sp.]
MGDEGRGARVMLVCDYSLGYLGGAQTALVRQARALAELGWHVVVVAPGAYGAFAEDAMPNLVAVEPRVRFTIPGLDLPVLPRRERLVRGLVDLGREHRVDAVIAHSEFTIAAAALDAAGQLGVPMLHTVHTFFWRAPRALSPAAPAVTAFHRALTGLPRRPLYVGGNGIENALRGMTLRVAARASCVLSPSRHQAEALRAAGVDRVEVLSNVAQPIAPGAATAAGDGSDPEPAAATATATASAIPAPSAADAGAAHHRPLTLVWAGRFAPEKRLGVALEAVRFANLLSPDSVRLHVAGGDHEPVAGVEFHGRLTSDEVARLIEAADAVLLTSVGFDNQPMIALEAFARARAIIVSDPVLRAEFDGAAIGAAGEDAAGLVETLLELAADRSALSEARDRALDYARKRQPTEHARRLRAIIDASG